MTKHPLRLNVHLYRLAAIGILCILATSVQAEHASNEPGETISIYEVQISLNLRNVSLKEALAALEKKTEFTFVYNSRKINAGQKVNLQANRQPLAQVLDGLLAGKGLTYKQVNRNLVITPEKNKARILNGSLRGRVIDRNQDLPLPGATIFLPELGRGTSTNAEGFFQLSSIPAGNYQLIIHGGYYRRPYHGSRCGNGGKNNGRTGGCSVR
jgi:hypothetical protein